MSNNNHWICLEDFSDEIFLYEIFPFFSWEELYGSFFGLNQRFNQILQSSKQLDLVVNKTSINHPAFTFFAPCAARLTVCLGQFDITPFSGLRSLILQYPSLHQRNSIRPENFPLLEYLKLSYPLEDSILLNLIFSNAFKYLEVCHFDRSVTQHTSNGSPKLRSLSISVHDSYGIICILRACPNLSRLNIIVYDTPQNDLSLPRHSISCMSFFLQRLFIRSKFEILTAVLTLTPNLKWLTFEDITSCLTEASPRFNFKILANILSTLRQLSYLHFEILTLVRDQYTSFRTLHPLFMHVTMGRKHSSVLVSGSMAESRELK